MAIINSILDQDLYKLSQQKAVLSYAPGTQVVYKFHNRRPEGKFNEEFIKALKKEINSMGNITLTSFDKVWLGLRCPFLDEQYLTYLSNYRYNPQNILCSLQNNELQLVIGGPWEQVILWEVPLMAVISELFFRYCDTEWKFCNKSVDRGFNNKASILKNCVWADFGTRRRRSHVTHARAVGTFKDKVGFIGTSNVCMARLFGVRPLGTMAHEWIMGVSALEGLRHANKHALRIWSDVFEGNLGIALTDTFGTEAFLQDFSLYFAKLFDGVRHDSGNPLYFGERIITHYNEIGIDPTTKTIVFSDNLTPDKAAGIEKYFRGRIKTSFGIGTNFTNDFTDDFPNSKPLNMVIKMDSCNYVPVVKLSDDPGKQTGDEDALRVANWTFGQGKL